MGPMAPGPKREPSRRVADPDSLDSFARLARRRGQRPDSAELGRLLTAAGGGDQGATDELLRAHLDLVVGAAKERRERGLSQSDLFQEGALGLVSAISEFRASGQPNFEAYALNAIRIQMDRALEAEADCVRRGTLLVRAAEDYDRAQVELRRELGRDPANAELAEKLEWSGERTQEIGRMVDDARRRHDEELLQYLDPAEPPAAEDTEHQQQEE
jgi:RNA polymerase sigma factor (sigma-70 family)